MSKRKKVVLSLKDKIDIIDSLEKGESGCKLADQYGVGRSTISDIKRNTDSIMFYSSKLESEDCSKHRKTMKKPKNEVLENALYCWLLKKRSTGQPITGPLLCAEALKVNKQLGGDKSFVASNGWLYRFKCRHGIRDLEVQGEKATKYVDVNAAIGSGSSMNAANSLKDDEIVVTKMEMPDETEENLEVDNDAGRTGSSMNAANSLKDDEIVVSKMEMPDEAEENLEVDNDAGPSHDEAFQALETALKWFEKQTESDSESLVQLKRIRDLAAMKRRGGLGT